MRRHANFAEWVPLGLIRESRLPQKAMIQVVAINYPAGDRAFGVVGRSARALARSSAGAGSIELGVPAIGRAREAVHHAVAVKVLSGHRPKQVDAKSADSLSRCVALARHIELRENALATAQEAVILAVRVNEISGDFALEINACRRGVSGIRG